MQDPESLYRQAKDRLSELHAAADRRSMIHRARAQTRRANRPSGFPQFLRWLLSRFDRAASTERPAERDISPPPI